MTKLDWSCFWIRSSSHPSSTTCQTPHQLPQQQALITFQPARAGGNFCSMLCLHLLSIHPLKATPLFWCFRLFHTLISYQAITHEPRHKASPNSVSSLFPFMLLPAVYYVYSLLYASLCCWACVCCPLSITLECFVPFSLLARSNWNAMIEMPSWLFSLRFPRKVIEMPLFHSVNPMTPVYDSTLIKSPEKSWLQLS